MNLDNVWPVLRDVSVVLTVYRSAFLELLANLSTSGEIFAEVSIHPAALHGPDVSLVGLNSLEDFVVVKAQRSVPALDLQIAAIFRSPAASHPLAL